MVEAAKCKDMNDDERIPADDCVCPDGKCHLGREMSRAKDVLCDKCINLWFQTHLRHRIKMMLKPDGVESKCIAMRSLLQFLGLSSHAKPSAGTFELMARKKYNDDTKLAEMRNSCKRGGCSKITYEIRADNLGGESFDKASVKCYKQDNPKEAKVLARFLYGVHVHTAHLTWGANHSDKGPIWDINDSKANQEAVREICILLQKRVYKRGRKLPWDEGYRYTGDHDEDGLPTTE